MTEVKWRLEDRQTVIVIAWTKENRIDVYVEPHNFSPQSDTYNSVTSTNNGISVLGAIATFILSVLLVSAVGGGGLLGYCCFPIILAVVAYFVTPMVIKSLQKD